VRRLVASLLCVPVLSLIGGDAAGSPANAESPTPIEITLAGPSAVRIRVANGSTFPCDSADNRLIVSGKFEPHHVLRSSTSERCVCLQQTYAPFADVDWGASSMVCRPQICKWAGRSKHCVPAPDPTIRVTVRSTRPS